MKPSVLWPAGHFWQSARSPAENQFSGHGTQSSWDVRLVRPSVHRPAGQLMQEPCDLTFWYEFFGQSVEDSTWHDRADCRGLSMRVRAVRWQVEAAAYRCIAGPRPCCTFPQGTLLSHSHDLHHAGHRM